MDVESQAPAGSLSWRLSSHPITLLCFLGFRICELLCSMVARPELMLNSGPPGLPLRRVDMEELVGHPLFPPGYS